jgi:hypothetical protein
MVSECFEAVATNMKEEVTFPMYRVSQSVRVTYSEDGATVLAIHTGKVLRSNPTGSLVLQYLQQRATVSEIIAAISSRFGLPSTVAIEDVREFLATLEQLRLVYKLPAAVGAQGMPNEFFFDCSKPDLTGGTSK